ncbi:MAG: hypothetical protein G8345_11870 [Magnetococcales bacterium]|nr:V-type ATP synthase subunit F [Magnetococcales bacterium]NGZ27569.1 hypothetical protein [Magnetococcales bacterium]
MAAPCFIGDELSAAGWRLAGFEILVPTAKELEEAVRQTISRVPLLILTGEMANRLPRALMEQLLASVNPMVLVVPTMQPASQGLDVAARIRSQLGITT